ncbi:unnamed protein product [Caenorhabditis auriculariae]|uniref:Uncharacterized protein n=1 Tax=Caenorhabditis auriculariae TaxID=2777116 RepID=A0A8S1HDH9_9PELO|nr:unnamed protein product [Caenorhabditis auriculariae]
MSANDASFMKSTQASRSRKERRSSFLYGINEDGDVVITGQQRRSRSYAQRGVKAQTTRAKSAMPKLNGAPCLPSAKGKIEKNVCRRSRSAGPRPEPIVRRNRPTSVGNKQISIAPASGANAPLVSMKIAAVGQKNPVPSTDFIPVNGTVSNKPSSYTGCDLSGIQDSRTELANGSVPATGLTPIAGGQPESCQEESETAEREGPKSDLIPDNGLKTKPVPSYARATASSMNRAKAQVKKGANEKPALEAKAAPPRKRQSPLKVTPSTKENEYVPPTKKPSPYPCTITKRVVPKLTPYAAVHPHMPETQKNVCEVAYKGPYEILCLTEDSFCPRPLTRSERHLQGRDRDQHFCLEEFDMNNERNKIL